MVYILVFSVLVMIMIILMILFLLMDALGLAFAIAPLVKKINVFRRQCETTGIVTSITSSTNLYNNKISIVNIDYNVNSKMYSSSCRLLSQDCAKFVEDSVLILYDKSKPENSHISFDSDSGLYFFKRLIVVMAAITVFSLGEKNILLYLSSNASKYISTIMFCVFWGMFFLVIGVYAVIYLLLSRSSKATNGIVMEQSKAKGYHSYKIQYTVNSCVFSFISNSKIQMKLGDSVKVSYLEYAPFIAQITK